MKSRGEKLAKMRYFDEDNLYEDSFEFENNDSEELSKPAAGKLSKIIHFQDVCFEIAEKIRKFAADIGKNYFDCGSSQDIEEFINDNLIYHKRFSKILSQRIKNWIAENFEDLCILKDDVLFATKLEHADFVSFCCFLYFTTNHNLHTPLCCS